MHRCAEVLHGLKLQIILTLTMKNINLQLNSGDDHIQDNLASGPTESMQSISWLLKVTRLFHRANIALELFRIYSKGISPFFIISTIVADQRLCLVLSIHGLTCCCSASTLDERIKLGHGHWCGSHVGSCFKGLLCPDNGLISSIFMTC